MDQDDRKKQRGDTLKRVQDLFGKTMYSSVIANGPGESLRKAQAASSLLMSGGFAELVSKAQVASSLVLSGGFAEQVSKANLASSLMMPDGFAEQVSKASLASALMMPDGFAEMVSRAQVAGSLMRSGGFAEQLRKAQEAASFMRSSNSMGFSPSMIGSVLAGSPVVHAGAVSMYLNTARDAANNTSLVGVLGNSSSLWGENGLKAISQSAQWLERQKESALYNYLTAVGTEDVLDFLSSEEDFSSDSVMLDVSTWEEVPVIEPEAESEIIDLLKNGRSLSQLSDGSRKYWLTFCFCLFFTLMDHASALITVGTWVQSTIAAAKNPSEVRKQLGGLSGEQRVFMEGQSVTTGEQVILRSSFSTDSPELGRLARGVFLDVLEGSKDGWVHVLAEIDGEAVEGWVARRYVVVF